MNNGFLDSIDEDLREGRVSIAIAKLQVHVERSPEDIAAIERLAFSLHRIGELKPAAAIFGRLAKLTPNSAGAANNFASVLGQLGRPLEALEHYGRAIGLDETNLDARRNRARLFEDMGKPNLAIGEWRQIAGRIPSDPLAWYRLGDLLSDAGFRLEAQRMLDEALRLDGEFVEARWARTMSILPQAFAIRESPEAFYAEYERELEALDIWLSAGRDGKGHRAVGMQKPYYLVYHDRNNAKPMRRYGALCARLMAAWYGNHEIVRRAPDQGLIRVTIASGHIHDHAVWTAIIRGWCQSFNREQFALSIVYTGDVTDRETASARASVIDFIHGRRELGGWVDTLRELEPDIILYPEIGMDPICIKLASLRLAPVQVASWGHPETSGMPTIDYFLSAEAFEPSDAEQNYCERLVKLDGIGSRYAALSPEPKQVDLASLNIDPNRPIALCPATPYKFLPEHDWTFAAIAREVEDCQLVFVIDNIAPHLSGFLQERLQREFARQGLDSARYVRFIPRQERPAFFGLMRQSSIYLDAIGFSGFNTAMQAFECALPVVTVEGRFLRNRFASGLLREMDIRDLIAADSDSYVQIAAKLLKQLPFRQRMKNDIKTQFPKLLDRKDSIRSLEEFLRSTKSASVGVNR